MRRRTNAAQGRTPHGDHQDRARDGGRGRGLCCRQGRWTRQREPHPPTTSSFITATLRLLAESLEVIQQTANVILAALEPPIEDEAEHRPPMQRNSRRWRHEDHTRHLAEGRRLAARPLPQDRKPALHGACHRGAPTSPARADFLLSPLLTTANRTAMPCATRRCVSSLAWREART